MIPLEERKRLRREAAKHAKKKKGEEGNAAAEQKRLNRLRKLNEGPDVVDATGGHRGKAKAPN